MDDEQICHKASGDAYLEEPHDVSGAHGGRRPLVASLALLGCVALAVNAVFPVVVVQGRPAATVGYVAGILLGAVGAGWNVRRSRRAVQVVVWLSALSITLLAVLVGSAVFLFRGMETVSRDDVPSWGSVVTYRVNGGATTSYTQWVRTERHLLPGLLLVTSTVVKRCDPAESRC